MKKISLIAILISLLIFSCDDNKPTEEKDEGKLTLNFLHKINGENIDFDSLKYTNEAANNFQINEIQYFISNLTIYKNGNANTLDGWTFFKYIDTDILSSNSWQVYDKIESGAYDSLSFTFGFDEVKNQSFMFSNPPESIMIWPEEYGGGYHYLKLNGKWKDNNNFINNFAFHLGIGRDTTTTPTSYIHNYFRVSLAGSSFVIKKESTTELNIVMNVENWFKSPNIYDHNTWGGDIMNQQAAMHIACINGHDVFTIEN